MGKCARRAIRSQQILSLAFSLSVYNVCVVHDDDACCVTTDASYLPVLCMIYHKHSCVDFHVMDGILDVCEERSLFVVALRLWHAMVVIIPVEKHENWEVNLLSNYQISSKRRSTTLFTMYLHLKTLASFTVCSLTS